MTDDRTLRDVVIVGGGTAGWMAAAAFARFLHNGVTRVTLIESDEIGTVGVGEATIPPIVAFNRMLGIDEDAFLSATGGTIKLGIEFHDWGRMGERYLHPFGEYGQPLAGVAFHQLWAKLSAAGRADPLDDYAISATAARAGRFAREAGDPRSPFARPTYAYHFDASLYARFLRTHAGDRVARIEGRIVSVERDARGHVSRARLADGRTVEGDLWIDCSGFRSMLLGEELGVSYRSWAHWLPCDRAVAVPTANVAPPRPYTRAFARAAGWQWRIPLQHRTGNGLVYSSAHWSEGEAEAALLSELEGAPAGPARHLRFTAGRRERFWEANVVALGLSGGFLEPLESTSIHLIQAGISKLLALMPDRRFVPAERDAYNRLMARTFEGVRDFVILHYAATSRDDTPFWRDVRAMTLPDTLAEKLALWRARGRFFRYDDELFDTANWVAVLYGQGVHPDGWDPVADALDADRVADALGRMRAMVAGAVAAMPTHAEFLARHCAMAAA
jgi:tryptophan halogenase